MIIEATLVCEMCQECTGTAKISLPWSNFGLNSPKVVEPPEGFSDDSGGWWCKICNDAYLEIIALRQQGWLIKDLG